MQFGTVLEICSCFVNDKLPQHSMSVKAGANSSTAAVALHEIVDLSLHLEATSTPFLDAAQAEEVFICADAACDLGLPSERRVQSGQQVAELPVFTLSHKVSGWLGWDAAKAEPSEDGGPVCRVRVDAGATFLIFGICPFTLVHLVEHRVGFCLKNAAGNTSREVWRQMAAHSIPELLAVRFTAARHLPSFIHGCLVLLQELFSGSGGCDLQLLAFLAVILL